MGCFTFTNASFVLLIACANYLMSSLIPHLLSKSTAGTSSNCVISMSKIFIIAHFPSSLLPSLWSKPPPSLVMIRSYNIPASVTVVPEACSQISGQVYLLKNISRNCISIQRKSQKGKILTTSYNVLYNLPLFPLSYPLYPYLLLCHLFTYSRHCGLLGVQTHL